MHAGIYMNNKLPRELNYSVILLNRASGWILYQIRKFKISKDIK